MDFWLEIHLLNGFVVVVVLLQLETYLHQAL